MRKTGSKFVLVALLIFSFVLMTACSGGGQSSAAPSEAAPAQSPAEGASSEAAPEEAPSEAASGDLWTDIQARGKLIVGTSADYPPHEYVENGEFVGFDMDIIKEVGKRLNLEVEIIDMGFDTLIAALKQGKIDCIISCMSASPERREQVDFTEIYWRGTHTFLIKTGSDVVLNDPLDTANYTIGVQSGTSHDMWITDNLLNAGLTTEDKIFRFEKTDMGILDLNSGRIDIFFTETPTSKAYLRNNPDLQAALEFDANPVYGGSRIGVQKGQGELLNHLNDTLLAMMDEGVVAGMEDTWLNVLAEE